MGRRFSYNTAHFRAQYSATLNDIRLRNAQHLATENPPRNLRVSKSQAKGYTPLPDVRVDRAILAAMRAPSNVGTKRMAKNGCTILNIMNQAMWRDDLKHSYGGVKK